MDFLTTQQYIDVCVDYALAYSAPQLSSEFSKTVNRISSKYPESKTPPIRIQVYIDEWTTTPTNIEDGLWFFFGNRLTNKWPDKTFLEYFEQVKSDTYNSYLPFRVFDETDFEDAMRLRTYQDTLNIISGRKIDIPSKRKYTILQRLIAYKKNAKPDL